MFRGVLINLRKIEKQDLEAVEHWLASPDFIHRLYGNPLTHPLQWTDQARTLMQQGTKIYGRELPLLIESLGSTPPTPMGLILYYNINWRSRTAEWNIFIGDPQKRGQRASLEACLLGACFALQELDLRKLVAYIYAFNAPALKIVRRAQAHIEGTLQKHIYRDGTFHNVLIASLFRKPFFQLLSTLEHSLLRFCCKGARGTTPPW